MRPALLCTLLLGSALLSGPARAATADTSGPMTVQSQGSFFIGGTARHAEGLSGGTTGPEVARMGAITTGQMYVQYQIPVAPRHLPVVLVHGGGLSGQAYETTPDGRMGWNEYLLRAGRPVYSVDQAGRGRSGFDGSTYNLARLGAHPAAENPPIQIIGHEYAYLWFRIGPKLGTPYADTQFPVEAIDDFYKMWIPDLNAALPNPNPSYADLAALAQKVGGAVLIGHSESFMFPERAALLNPAAVKGIISLESGYACNTTFTPEERKTLAGIPILIVFADHHAEAPEPFGSRWTTSIGQCHDFADSLRKEGGDVTFMSLPEQGMHGNSHMFMLDRNNLEIADLLIGWIDRHVEHAAK